MKGVRWFLAILLVVIISACSEGRQNKSLPDNPENRTLVAKRYLEIMPPQDLLQSIAGKVVLTMQEKDRKLFLEVMNNPEVEKAVYRISLDGLVKHFTVDELNAMVAFYGSPEGRSFHKKFTPYMEEIMPRIQQLVKVSIEMEKGKSQAPPKPGLLKSPQSKEQEGPPGKK